MPLMIDLYLADPRKCGIRTSDGDYGIADYSLTNVRLCCTILDVNEMYVKSFETALEEGIRYGYRTFYNYYRDCDNDVGYFIKVPKRYVSGVYVAPAIRASESNGTLDAFKYVQGAANTVKGIVSCRLAVGSKSFREIQCKSLTQWDLAGNDGVEFYEKFLQGAGVTDASHGFACDITRLNFRNKYWSFCENLDRDPDNSVSSYSTLAGNDIAVYIRMARGSDGGGGAGDAGLRIYNFIHYLSALVIGKNNIYQVLDR